MLPHGVHICYRTEYFQNIFYIMIITVSIPSVSYIPTCPWAQHSYNIHLIASLNATHMCYALWSVSVQSFRPTLYNGEQHRLQSFSVHVSIVTFIIILCHHHDDDDCHQSLVCNFHISFVWLICVLLDRACSLLLIAFSINTFCSMKNTMYK